MLKTTLRYVFSLIILSFGFSTSVFAFDDWKPVTQEELAQKTSKVEADADAEAIFWEVKVDDSGRGLTISNYVRVKVFTDRGREKYSKIDIPYYKGTQITSISARVIKADGTILDVKKADVFDRDIVKTNGLKLKAKSFAVAGIEAGVIFEYRYNESNEFGGINQMRLQFQRDIPIQSMTYFVKPTGNVTTGQIPFNMPVGNFAIDKGGFSKRTMTNVPSLKDEPNMPPEDEVRAWTFLYYNESGQTDPTKVWKDAAKSLKSDYDIKDTLKPNDDIKNAISGILESASTDDDKIRKLFDFCRTKIRNISYDTTLTAADRFKIKLNKSPAETLKNAQGRINEINNLFASLAVAAGYETRIAFSGDRSEIFFSSYYAHDSFVRQTAVAVKINGEWRYYDPGSKFVPFGILAWNDDGQTAFLLGLKDAITVAIPMSGTDKTIAKRTGKFKLLEDGTLVGEVMMAYSGQFYMEKKLDAFGDNQAKQEEELISRITRRISTAEISKIRLDTVDDSKNLFNYSYQVRIPNYATKTGKRLFLQPGYFEFGSKPRFSSATRTYDIYFRYPWSENDEISIELPSGFALDSADSPGGAADSGMITSLSFDLKLDKTNNVLIYKRNFFFGGKSMIYFPKTAYPQLKGLFDGFNKDDSHVITLKQN
jgi:Domain of Unknown Function with PDB structure (DUF3857)